MKKHAEPGIDEVRAARMEISERYGHNVDRMLADHMKQQERYADRLVTLDQAQGRRKASRRRAKITTSVDELQGEKAIATELNLLK